jgi:hypothetical protein
MYMLISSVFFVTDMYFLTLREEHKLRVFENGVLSRIRGPKRAEVTGDWRKLHNDINKAILSIDKGKS